METVFVTLLNLSITASWLVLAVAALRILLRKAPKAVFVFMWALVAVRLICPFSPESVFSLIPSGETVPAEILYAPSPEIQSGIPFLNSAVNPVLSETMAPQTGASVNPMQTVLFIASLIWLAGLVVMLCYLVFSALRVRKKVREAVPLQDEIWLCDRIDTPFIFGMIRPRIYLPSNMEEADLQYVIAHEKAHLKRRDHLWKPLGFFLLCVYWFNPVLWAAYILLCRDIELACDEKVIRQLGTGNRKAYSNALINCSVPRRTVAACPLAFGEIGVKNRIRSVLSYKKPTLWIMIFVAVACIILAVGFLTNPKTEPPGKLTGITAAAECDNIEYAYLHGTLNAENPYLCAEWKNCSEQVLCFGEDFVLYKDGAVYQPNRDLSFSAILNIVKPGGKHSEVYSLPFWDFPAGSYRLEKIFYFENNPDETYKAYLEFTVENNAPFSEKTYRGETIVYESGIYSSIVYTDETLPSFYVSETDFHLLTDDHPQNGLTDSLYDLGRLKKIDLKKENFDALFDSDFWHDGLSAAKLRKNNKNAYSVFDKSGRLYYLLEQKNGELLVAQGYSEFNTFRWVFRLVPSETSFPAPSGAKDGLESLKMACPGYFGLSTDNGLTVYVWQMAENSYSCGLLPGKTAVWPSEKIWGLSPVSMESMRAIVAAYGLPREEITVLLIGQPASSYLYEINEQTQAETERLFWQDFPAAPETES